MADDDTNPTDDDSTDDEQAQDLLADAVAQGDDGDSEDTTQRGHEQHSGGAQRALDRLKAERQKLRQDLAAAQTKVQEYEDATKSESQRQQEAAETLKSRAEKAESAHRRFEVAFANAPEHATPAQIRAVAKRLAGESDDDLETDAAELFDLVSPPPQDTTSPPATEPEEPQTPRVASRPTERMPRGGGNPDEPPEETDPRKLAAMIPRAR